ncbi:hypothetical protein AB0M02_05205 [Actinoplanes sp. NPDC051861]|uniref:hypothetical protein n=1 Tax=Actinoplanes sp. NPDC051861 TaxID=3155170 RepID=UPI00343FDAF4
MELAEQLLRLIDSRLLDPLEILLEDDREVTRLREQLRLRAAEWADTIEHGSNSTAVRALARLIATLYPDDHAFAPSVDWWRAPLGQATVRLVGHPFAHSVSYATAGAMLGISRQGVHDLVKRGRLPRHEDGGVPVAAVRRRLLGEVGGVGGVGEVGEVGEVGDPMSSGGGNNTEVGFRPALELGATE